MVDGRGDGGCFGGVEESVEEKIGEERTL